MPIRTFLIIVAGVVCLGAAAYSQTTFASITGFSRGRRRERFVPNAKVTATNTRHEYQDRLTQLERNRATTPIPRN